MNSAPLRAAACGEAAGGEAEEGRKAGRPGGRRNLVAGVADADRELESVKSATRLFFWMFARENEKGGGMTSRKMK